MDNSGTLLLDLVNAEGEPAADPSCGVEVLRLDQVSILRANNLQFPPKHRFTLPAFPQAQNLRCVITPSLYRIVQSEFFTLMDGSEKDAPALVLRDPDKWKPRFTPWNSLPAPFSPLKSILADKLLKLKHGPNVGVVTPAIYDEMNSPALSLAKMALLNLFAVLNTETDPVSVQPWFSFIKQILVIDQERFVAIVSSGLYESVDHIRQNMGQFKRLHFFPGDVSLHHDNIPSEYTIPEPLISVKCAYEWGNIQFTLGKATSAAGDCILLDCDMDEHSNLIVHLSDVFKHYFTGGTNPVDIHEYIMHHQRGGTLGYSLHPVEDV